MNSDVPEWPKGARVFISHASLDFKVADDVRRRLEAVGVPCWIAPRDIPLGSSYASEIANAVTKATALVLILTEGANNSQPVANEVEMAFRHQRVIIPVRLKPVEPGMRLAFFVNNTQWVDAFHTPLKDRVREIARIVRAIASGKPPEPAEPEKRTALGVVERRLEDAVRYKFLTLSAALTALAVLGAFIALNSGRTWNQLQRDQQLVDTDSVTYGLVNLAAEGLDGESNRRLALRATVYLNLKDPHKAQATWVAHWSGPGANSQPLDVAPLHAMTTPSAQVLSLQVPATAQSVVFCLRALHPGLAKRYTALWAFAVDTAREPISVVRTTTPRLAESRQGDCEP